MAGTLIGAGGWGYFSGGLLPYARAFDFVEVNATFYRQISELTARRWRASVPATFTFAVKVHRDVTHRARMRPTPTARAAYVRTAHVSRVLRAPFLLLETAGSLAFGPEEVDGLKEFAASTPEGIRLGLEARAHAPGALPRPLVRCMEDAGILDVVDLSRMAPRIEADAIYTRVFGKGEHNLYQFDDDELREIDRVGHGASTAAFAFHGVRMYKDAARFLAFRRSGAFPPATSSTGLNSLAEVLAPDVRFPAARDGLLRDHGWKVVDVDATHRTHAEAYLARLPARTYDDLDEVLQALGGKGPTPSA